MMHSIIEHMKDGPGPTPAVQTGRGWLAAGLSALLVTGTLFGGEVRWRGGVMETGGGGAEAASVALVELNAEPGRRHIVVQFDRAVSTAQREALVSAGLKLLSYLGNDAYFAVLAPEGVDVEEVFRVSSPVDARAIQPAWKLHPTLAAGKIPFWAVVSGEEEEPNESTVVGAYLLFHPDVPLDADSLALVEDHLAEIGTRLSIFEEDMGEHRLHARVTPTPFYDPHGERLKK